MRFLRDDKLFINNNLQWHGQKSGRKSSVLWVFFSLAGGLLFHNDFHSREPANLFVSDRFKWNVPQHSRNCPQYPQAVLLTLRLDRFGAFVARCHHSGARRGEIFQPARQRFRDFGFQMHMAIQHFRVQHAAAGVDERKMPAV